MPQRHRRSMKDKTYSRDLLLMGKEIFDKIVLAKCKRASYFFTCVSGVVGEHRELSKR